MMSARILIAVLLVVTASCSGDRKKIVSTENAAMAIGPYSQAVEKGGVLYISGQIALTPEGLMDTATFDDECRRALANAGHILKAAGKQPPDVCKVTVYMTDLSMYTIFNKIYAEYFTDNFPAREVVEVSALPRNAHLEISMIAK